MVLADAPSDNCAGTSPTDAGYDVSGHSSCHLSASASTGGSMATDAYLGALSDHGGQTQTVALELSPSSGTAGDPAVNAIPAGFDLSGRAPPTAP